jgi:nicotinamide-nucleotide amidase
MNEKLSGKVAFITGGARGIGRATALKLASAGCDVAIAYHNSHEDDRTRHALARLTGTPLLHNQQAWKQITAYIEQHWPGRAIAESNRRQALMPRGVKILKNDRGTAPGMLARMNGAYLACMPGVPHEMKAMVQRLCEGLEHLFPDMQVPYCEEIHFSGCGESRAQDLLGQLLAGDKPQVGICAHEEGHITIRIRGARTSVQRRCARIKKILNKFLLPGVSLAASIVEELNKRGALITCAESCTAGRIVAQIGAVPGASAVLHESLVAYHNDVKIRRLHVNPQTIDAHGVVSEAVVEAMARGALLRSGADFALASSGIAGPDGGSAAKPIGTVWIAAAMHDHVISQQLSLRGDRERIQRRAAAEALRLLWQLMISQT